eukprot:UC1_evm1s282
MNNNALVAIGSGSAKPVTTFTADTKAPTLTRFEVSMDGAGEFVFVFDETMQTSKIDPTKITFVNGAQSLKLTGGSFSKVQADDSTMLKLVPLKADLDKLKLNTELAVSRVTTSITFTKEAFSDMNNQFVNAISVSRTADSFVEDTTKPVLTSFNFDYDQSTIVLAFTEPIRDDSVLVETIFVHDGQGTSHQLKESSTDQYGQTVQTTFTVNAEIVTLSLSSVDLNAIKQLAALAFSPLSTIITLDGTVKDMADNALAAVTRHVDQFAADTIAPSAVNIDVNMNTGMVDLIFEEVVTVETLSGITLMSQAASVKLTDSVISVGRGPVITLKLSQATANQMKVLRICNQKATCKAQIAFAAFADSFSLPFSAVVKDVSVLVADTTAPALVDFSVDLTAETLTMEFSETVLASSLD